ncbi:PTS-dependent dihydroxyacetone kinase phosphotransferase subunit DhaM [Staphylococcus auricularis]|uniref:phosphoenolpyruvate--glycerone phosphotransferase n=1 Tax=Staphylococcus auricularis TaxID=29379 RepID=A0AAP8PP06_9STAP|nr:dihydroxyacetone kinase phosphoryl donor subunit DhaM [Staphylococcus auricularis]PNZ66991.1 PTS-dependent dihydroxyacetone kinase phosphotransferase subunit DhaM [Staphylococcus auricularis]QPT05899.1 PTS-dependent dihydroxyacetone kinase phosphotransferase subunit DhaM [Staphylococcus auricularis]SQJ07135.1 PTS system mannnose-specific family transporter subunit IIA [Staphylococcus auricularis]BCU51609.1 PTS-dependent dihydroxyacetone kinase phosphotransferase subunit DhaM [Staphylococcus 
MTSIVLVSHSDQVAQGTKAILQQMVSNVEMVGQGGHQGEIGTSYEVIQQMIDGLNDDAICFYDIGSAGMNLDMSLELYQGSQRIVKVESPIVEGSFTAAVKLSLGASIDEVLDELDNNFPKSSQ